MCCENKCGCNKKSDAGCTTTEVEKLRQNNQELEDLFDLIYAANLRGIKLWHERNPGKEKIFPDTAELISFLIEENDKLRTELDKFKSALNDNEKDN